MSNRMLTLTWIYSRPNRVAPPLPGWIDWDAWGDALRNRWIDTSGWWVA